MFGTLAVQLPVAGGHAGGDLVVSHGGESFTFRYAEQADSAFRFAAFYADCTHELKPITAGNRVVLLYNLVRTTPGATPKPVDITPTLHRMRKATQEWESTEPGTKLVAHRLEHKYTERNLAFSNLKGRDLAMVDAARRCGVLDVHLVLLRKHQIGEPDDPGYGYSRHRRRYHRGRYDDSDDDDSDEYGNDGSGYTMGEVFDETVDTVCWISSDDKRQEFKGINVDNDDVLDEDEPLFDEDGEPDETSFEGYTGNAGPTLEYTYRVAALVLWPKSKALDIIETAVGFDGVLGLLERQATDAWTEETDRIYQKVLGYVSKEASAFPGTSRGTWGSSAARPSGERSARVMNIFCRLHDCSPPKCHAAILATLKAMKKEGIPTLSVARALVKVAKTFDDIGDHIVQLVKACPHSQIGMCIAMCVELGQTPSTEHLYAPIADVILSIRCDVADVDVAAAIVDFACGPRERERGHTAQIVRQVSAHAKRKKLVQILASRLNVCQAAAYDEDVASIVRSRMERLSQIVAAGAPAASWKQPAASFPRYPQVEAFLRGPERAQTFRLFSDYDHACNWAAKYFGDSWRSGGLIGGATAKVGGTIYDPSVTLTKITSDAVTRQQQYEKCKDELARLSKIKLVAPGTTSEVSSGAGPAAAAQPAPSGKGCSTDPAPPVADAVAAKRRRKKAKTEDSSV